MRIAVIGAGISGLASAWLLRQSHAVTLYEAGPRLGGHSNTITVQEENHDVSLDTGFIVFNERNYPHLCALFKTLGVASKDSDMSFAASLNCRAKKTLWNMPGTIFSSSLPSPET